MKTKYDVEVFGLVVAESNSLSLAIPSDGWLAKHWPDPEKRAALIENARQLAADGLIPTKVIRVDPATPTACFATYAICSSPMRGGLEFLYTETATGSTGAVGMCSTGFTVRKNDVPYMLTAGHCTGPGNYFWSATNNSSDHSSFRYGAKVAGYAYNQITVGSQYYDVALIQQTTSQWWGPSNDVMVFPSTQVVGGVTYTTTRDETYDISSAATSSTYPPSQGYVCKSGATTLTSCGSTTTSSTDGMLRAHFTNCQGDSGGAVYLGHRAYGTVTSIFTIPSSRTRQYWSGTSATAGISLSVQCYDTDLRDENGFSVFQPIWTTLAISGSSLW